jgi:hypothetical protein
VGGALGFFNQQKIRQEKTSQQSIEATTIPTMSVTGPG